MEMERTTTTPCCLKPNAGNGPQQSKTKCTADARPNAAPSVSFNFDCSICLDPAAEPVVTLCGHLYCWPCIYKWLQFGRRCCPVCKSLLTVDSLVPLYGRGGAHESSGVPRRPPSVTKPAIQEDEYDPFEVSGSRFSTRPSVFRSTAGGVLGGMAAALLPRLLGSGYYPRPYLLAVDDEESARMRRREAAVGDSLHQLWVLLCCCAVFCLLFF